MKRFLWVLILLYLSPARLSASQKTVVIIKSRNLPQYDLALSGFNKELNDRNIDYNTVNYREGDLIDGDLIFAIGSKAANTAVKQSEGIPIVFSMVLGPDKTLQNHPQVSGVSMDIPAESQFKILKKIIPKAAKIGVLYNPENSQEAVDEVVSEAKHLMLKIVAAEVKSMEDVYAAIRSIGVGIDALWMVPDQTVYGIKTTEDVLLYCLREKIAVIGLSPPYVKAGALFCMSWDYEDLGRQSGEIASKILSGRPIPNEIVSPRRTMLSLNLITAERIGLQIPEEMISSAKDIYE